MKHKPIQRVALSSTSRQWRKYIAPWVKYLSTSPSKPAQTTMATYNIAKTVTINTRYFSWACYTKVFLHKRTPTQKDSFGIISLLTPSMSLFAILWQSSNQSEQVPTRTATEVRPRVTTTLTVKDKADYLALPRRRSETSNTIPLPPPHKTRL